MYLQTEGFFTLHCIHICLLLQEKSFFCFAISNLSQPQPNTFLPFKLFYRPIAVWFIVFGFVASKIH